MVHLFIRTFTAVVFAATAASAKADLHRFYRGDSVSDIAAEVRVADARFRSDGRWMTLGSYVENDLRETPYLNLREADGRLVSSVALVPEGDLSCAPQSFIVPEFGLFDDIVVVCIEHDHRDSTAHTGLLLAHFDQDLQLTWSRRVRSPDLTFPNERGNVKLALGGGYVTYLVGKVQRIVGGQPDAGDVLLARIDPSSGDLVSPFTVGTADGEEGSPIFSTRRPTIGSFCSPNCSVSSYIRVHEDSEHRRHANYRAQ